MPKITRQSLSRLIEAAIFASPTPLSLKKIKQQLLVEYQVSHQQVTTALETIKHDYQHRSVNLVEVASGYRFQVVPEYAEQVSNLFQEKAPKYSRALLETLAMIAYKQPITRGEIEQVRGVSVSSQITKTLLERHWIKVVGHKDVPGKPALYATTKEFLDYFSLQSLQQLPELMPISEIALKSSEQLDQENIEE
ncbi:SMC-Scp complex subunit ScpB [Thalassotalea ganghwensis]